MSCISSHLRHFDRLIFSEAYRYENQNFEVFSSVRYFFSPRSKYSLHILNIKDA